MKILQAHAVAVQLSIANTISLTVVALLCCFTGTSSAAENQSNTTGVYLGLYNCKTQEYQNPPYQLLNEKILLYKLPENTLAFTIKLQEHNSFPMYFDSIPPAEYRVEFKNIFGQIVKKQVKIVSNDITKIVLCSDALANYPQNTLAKLQENDSITIDIDLRGCFNVEGNTIVITKKGDEFVAALYVVGWQDKIRHGKRTAFAKNRFLYKYIVLTQDNIATFKEFENELNYTPDRGCTTRVRYSIRSTYRTVEKIDGSCDWNGYYCLRSSFFGDR